MSADNYFRIFAYKHRFAVVMGFASDQKSLEPTDKDPLFDSLRAAAEWTTEQAAECGYEIDATAWELHKQRPHPKVDGNHTFKRDDRDLHLGGGVYHIQRPEGGTIALAYRLEYAEEITKALNLYHQ